MPEMSHVLITQANPQIAPLRNPPPTRASRRRSELWRGKRGKRENSSWGAFTQGGARSSLVLGYYQVIPPGFQFGSLRSQEIHQTHENPSLMSFRQRSFHMHS